MKERRSQEAQCFFLLWIKDFWCSTLSKKYLPMYRIVNRATFFDRVCGRMNGGVKIGWNRFLSTQPEYNQFFQK